MKQLRILILLGASVSLLFLGLLIYTFIQSQTPDIESAWKEVMVTQISRENLVGSWRNEAENSTLALTSEGKFTETFQQDVAESIAKYSIDYKFHLNHQLHGKWTLAGHMLKFELEGDAAKVSNIEIQMATYAAVHGGEAAKELKDELITNFSTTVPDRLNATTTGRLESMAIVAFEPSWLVLQRDGQRKTYARIR